MLCVYYKGEWLTLREAAAQAPVRSARVLRRRLRLGWDTVRALETRPALRSVETTLFAQAIARYLADHPEEAKRYV